MKRSVRYILVLLATLLMSSSALASIRFIEDFESYPLYDGGPAVDLGGEWLYYVNVFGPYSNGCNQFWYPYSGNAPNGPQISHIVAGATGKALNVYSDYANGNHEPGDNAGCIETNVFQERASLTATDIGLYTFRFETQVPLELGEGVQTYGFIKLLNPANDYAMDEFLTIETVTEGVKSLTINLDASAVGKILQWGFTNVASNRAPTGRWYDNVTFAIRGSGAYEGDAIGVPVPFWAYIAITGLLMFGGVAALRSRRNTG